MSFLSRRRALAFAGAAGAATALARPALAFPERSVRIVVPYNAGGITDVMSRAVAAGLQGVVGQSVVVENRAGANGSVGTLAAARAPADGHTLVMGITDTHAINPSTFRNLPYDPGRDFAPVGLVARVPFALMVGPTKRDVTDFATFLRRAKVERERYSFATWGVGSSSHLAYERLSRHFDFDKLHVPFTGQAPGMQAVAAGQVDSMMLPVGGAHALAQGGQARILATASQGRLSLTPDAPTLAEVGLDMTAGLWLGLFAPAGTPPAAVARLNAALAEAYRNPQLLDVFRQQATAPEHSTPEALGELRAREQALWAGIVREANIVAES